MKVIFIDFDETLIVQAALDSAYNRFIPFPTEGDRLATRRAQRQEFEALNRGEQIDFWRSKGGVIQEDRDGYTVVAFLRPGAFDFVSACLKIDPGTSILTGGKTSWQWKLARRLGLPNVDLFGRDAYVEIKSHPKNLLVDDLNPTTTGVQEKMKALGFQAKKTSNSVGTQAEFLYPTDRHIQVTPWDGQNNECRELIDIALPRIKTLL